MYVFVDKQPDFAMAAAGVVVEHEHGYGHQPLNAPLEVVSSVVVTAVWPVACIVVAVVVVAGAEQPYQKLLLEQETPVITFLLVFFYPINKRMISLYNE